MRISTAINLFIVLAFGNFGEWANSFPFGGLRTEITIKYTPAVYTYNDRMYRTTLVCRENGTEIGTEWGNSPVFVVREGRKEHKCRQGVYNLSVELRTSHGVLIDAHTKVKTLKKSKILTN